MGLGEPKKKVKYSIDPNALNWVKGNSNLDNLNSNID